jgi:hypothetical protein
VPLTINPPAFTYTKLAEKRVDMLAKATRDAAERARAIAREAGSSIGPITNADTGTFQLTATLDPPQVAPGDLITLTYRVTGSGWLGDTQILLPAADPNFRSYPPQELQRTESGELSVRQVVVPLNTNAVTLGAARLPYFDPVAGRYRESVAGPYRLEYVTRAATNAIPLVKHFVVQPPPAGRPARAASNAPESARWYGNRAAPRSPAATNHVCDRGTP